MLVELNQTISETLEQTATRNTTVISAVVNEVGALSTQLKKQVTNMTMFTANSTAEFNEIIGNMRTQFESLGEIPQTLRTQFKSLGKFHKPWVVQFSSLGD